MTGSRRAPGRRSGFHVESAPLEFATFLLTRFSVIHVPPAILHQRAERLNRAGWELATRRMGPRPCRDFRRSDNVV